MCVERRILKEICKTYPNSEYILKKKALLRRAFLRNSKLLVEEERKSSLSESITKRSVSSKQKKKKEIQEKLHQSLSVSEQAVPFHFQLKPIEVELDEFFVEGSVAFEKRSASLHSIREMPEATPGIKMVGKEENAMSPLKMNSSLRSSFVKEKKENTQKEKERGKKTESKTQVGINDILEKQLQEQKLIHRMQSLKVITFFSLNKKNFRPKSKNSIKIFCSFPRKCARIAKQPKRTLYL